MAKKGKGKGGGGGGKKGGAKKNAWQPVEVPDEPLMIRKPVGTFLTVAVRGVIWRMMDFTERVPASMKVYDLQKMIEERHGGGVVDFTLYKESVRAHVSTCTHTQIHARSRRVCTSRRAEKSAQPARRPICSAWRP